MSRLRIVLRRTGIICALVGSFSSSVAADPIRFASGRLVEGNAEAFTAEGDWSTLENDSTELLGVFSSVVSDGAPRSEFGLPQLATFTVSQHTDVSTTRWSGSGTAETAATGDSSSTSSVRAESFMFIEFTLAEPMSYRLTATLTGEGGVARMSLDGPMGLGWVFANGNAVPLVAMRRGLLAPGDYVFHVTAFSRSESFGKRRGTSAFDLNFALTQPVPEPATVLLFGTGAAFLGRRAWRRRREQSASGNADPIGAA